MNVSEEPSNSGNALAAASIVLMSPDQPVLSK
jgi:hypothetical protein